MNFRCSKWIWAVAAVFMLLGAGCLGSHAPREVYLRIGGNGGQCSGQEAGNKPVIMIRDLESLSVLDSQTVVLAKDNVLQQSTTWLWEGKPTEILGKLIENTLSCSSRYKVVARYSSRVEHAGLLYGDIKAFDVITGKNPKFVMTVDFELWTNRGKSILTARRFHTEAPMDKVEPGQIAAAADTAVKDIITQLGEWMDSIGFGDELS